MVEIREVTSKEQWEEFVLNYAGANFLQSWNWGEFYRSLGQEINRVGLFRDEFLVGVMLTIVEKARRAKYMIVPAGPLIDWEDGEVVRAFKAEILRQARGTRCSFIRVRPQVLENEQNSRMFAKMGFIKAPMHLHAELTHQVDSSKTEEELLAEMRKSTRYEIKQALKLEMQVTTTTNLPEVEAFYDLQMETAKRQGFVPFSKKFLVEQFRVFAQDDQIVLYTAWLNKMILAQAMVIFYGQEADYHYGASSEEGRQYPGAYLI